eukprot:PhF_6_TR37674/c0_g1_i1/m.56066
MVSENVFRIVQTVLCALPIVASIYLFATGWYKFPILCLAIGLILGWYWGEYGDYIVSLHGAERAGRVMSVEPSLSIFSSPQLTSLFLLLLSDMFVLPIIPILAVSRTIVSMESYLSVDDDVSRVVSWVVLGVGCLLLVMTLSTCTQARMGGGCSYVFVQHVFIVLHGPILICTLAEGLYEPNPSWVKVLGIVLSFVLVCTSIVIALDFKNAWHVDPTPGSTVVDTPLYSAHIGLRQIIFLLCALRTSGDLFLGILFGIEIVILAWMMWTRSRLSSVITVSTVWVWVYVTSLLSTTVGIVWSEANVPKDMDWVMLFVPGGCYLFCLGHVLLYDVWKEKPPGLLKESV